MDSVFPSDSDHSESANEILFVSDILQPFLFEPVFTAAKFKLKKTVHCL